jgi:Cof subfamily protein (haloacid dehalogenase superfamily)
MAIKLLLADVDGTLVTPGKALTPEAVAAAKSLREAGIRLAVTSGRPPRGMRMLVQPLELTGILAGFNGGVFVAPDMAVRKTHLLDPAVAREALEAVLHAGLDAWVYTQEEWLVRTLDAPHVAHEAQTVQFEAKVVTEFSDAHLADCAKIVGVSDDFPKVAAGERAAQQALGARASATRSQPYYLDITHPQANKGAVVDALAEMFGIDRAEIATIGDGGNDTLMFARSGLSIAMGNAGDDVKSKANVVTDTNENDGFAKAVRRYVLEQAG